MSTTSGYVRQMECDFQLALHACQICDFRATNPASPTRCASNAVVDELIFDFGGSSSQERAASPCNASVKHVSSTHMQVMQVMQHVNSAVDAFDVQATDRFAFTVAH
jgi:hypothetical protein